MWPLPSSITANIKSIFLIRREFLKLLYVFYFNLSFRWVGPFLHLGVGWLSISYDSFCGPASTLKVNFIHWKLWLHRHCLIHLIFVLPFILVLMVLDPEGTLYLAHLSWGFLFEWDPFYKINVLKNYSSNTGLKKYSFL